MTNPHRSETSPGAAPRPAGSTPFLASRVQYVVIGAVLAVMWLLGSGEPAWEHAARTALIVVVGLPLIYYRTQALRARRGVAPLPQLSLVRIIATKLALLVVALGVNYLLDPVTSHAGQIVAAGLFLIVALAGPRCHHLFMAPKHQQAS